MALDLGPLYPLIKPAAWPGQEKCITRPLVPGLKLPSQPLVSYCYSTSPFRAFLGAERLKVIGKTADQAAAEAIENLHKSQPRCSVTEIDLPQGGKLEVASCLEDPFAIERILHSAFMRHLQEKTFQTKGLAVAIPERPFMFAVPLERALDGKLLGLARHLYNSSSTEPDDKLSPDVFVLMDGQLCGRVVEEDGKTVVDFVAA